MHLNSWDNFLARIKGQGPEQIFFFFSFPLFIQYALTILERNTYCCIRLSIKKLMWVNNIATIDLTIFILQKNRLVQCLMVAIEKLASMLVWGLSGNPEKFNRKNYDSWDHFFSASQHHKVFWQLCYLQFFCHNSKWQMK